MGLSAAWVIEANDFGECSHFPGNVNVIPSWFQNMVNKNKRGCLKSFQRHKIISVLVQIYQS